MKKAFTFVELIFTILIMGILVGLGVQSLKQDYLRKDANYFVEKLSGAKFSAFGYDKHKDSSCIDLNADKIYQQELNDGEEQPYKFNAKIRSDIKRFCFDSYGRIYENFAYSCDKDTENHSCDNEKIILKNLLKDKQEVKLEFSGKSCKVEVQEFTGFAGIICN